MNIQDAIGFNTVQYNALVEQAEARGVSSSEVDSALLSAIQAGKDFSAAVGQVTASLPELAPPTTSSTPNPKDWVGLPSPGAMFASIILQDAAEQRRTNRSIIQSQGMQIVDLMVAELRERMIAQNMTINLTDDAYRLIAKEGTDAAYGARPLRRAIQRLLEDPLSEELLEGKWTSGSVIQASVSEDGESLAFVPGTGSIPAPRKHDNIARDAELLLTNFDLGHAGVSGSGSSASGGAAD